MNPYALWGMGVKISHIHCINQGGKMQSRAREGVKITISMQTLFIYLCRCVFACAVWSVVLLCFSKRQVSINIWECCFREPEVFLLIGSWNFYLTEVTALCHFKKLVGLKPSWCTVNPISLLASHTLKSFSFHWNCKSNHDLKTKWSLEHVLIWYQVHMISIIWIFLLKASLKC